MRFPSNPLQQFCMFSYAVRTNPADVARVESKTVICSQKKEDAIPTPAEGVKGTVGHWADPAETEKKLLNLFDGCMKGMGIGTVIHYFTSYHCIALILSPIQGFSL